VIAFYAPNDLALAYAKPGNPLMIKSRLLIHDYLGGTPAQRPGVYEAASPLHFVTKATPPTLMIHGSLDPMIWFFHDERLDKRLEEAGVPHFFLRLPWATHGCDANLSGPSGQLSTYAIERLLASVLPTNLEERVVQSNGRKPSHV
jgi:acetyl esterase/lipase